MSKNVFAVFAFALLCALIPGTLCGQPTQEELGIQKDFYLRTTEATCTLCLETFFKIQVSKYPLHSFLRHRCPALRKKGESDVCNRLVHFFLMNGIVPGAKSCTAVKYCDAGTLRYMRRSGKLKELNNLAGWGETRAGMVGIWGGYRLSANDNDDGDALKCLEKCKKVALMARMRFNLRGVHGLSILEDKACPKVKNAEGREMCRLAINYVRLNGAAESPERICKNISACSFHVTDKIVASSDKMEH